jgi:hypothetical protein
MSRRNLFFGAGAVVAAVIIVFGLWQLAQERSRLHSAEQQLARVDQQLVRAQTKERSTEAALTYELNQVRTLEYLSTTTTVAPVPLTDPQLLISTLDTVAEKLMGSLPPAGQEQQFVTQYHAVELRNAQLRAEGQVSTTLDPTAEAEAFINASDQAAVYAQGAGKLGQVLNCMIDPTAYGCSTNSSP